MAYARQCERCKRVIAPRGDATPKFCPFCGQPLSGVPIAMDPEQYQEVRGTSGFAVAALVLGLLSPVPMCGLLLGLLAIGFGLAAKRRIRESRGLYRGDGLATAGITLGIIGCLIQLIIFRGM